MTRAKALEVIHAAGAQGDHALFVRTYTGNRISYAVAIEKFRQGVAWARAIRARDAK